MNGLGWSWRGAERRLGILSSRPRADVGAFLHSRTEAIPLAIDGLDELLSASAVPNRLAHGFDRTLEGRVADALLRPHLLTQLCLGDDAIGMRQQIGEDLAHFVPQRPDLTGPAQLRALRIECTLAEDVYHRGRSPRWPPGRYRQPHAQP